MSPILDLQQVFLSLFKYWFLFIFISTYLEIGVNVIPIVFFFCYDSTKHKIKTFGDQDMQERKVERIPLN